MILHKDITAFKAAISTASENLKILPVFIEKDFWITLVLKRLADSKYKDKVVFKGGELLYRKDISSSNDFQMMWILLH